jgi:branched-chain amino acid transport system substrate-binding protein
MKKRSLMLVVLFTIAMMLIVACTPAPTGSEATTEATSEAPAMEMPAECSDASACVVIAPGDPIKIGFAGPMSGDNSNYGIDISQGGQLAIDDAGMIGDHAFELVVEDDQGTPEGGAQVANRFASSGDIVAINGHDFSGATNAAIPIYEEAKIAMMSPSATNPSLTTLGASVFNRVAFNDLDQGKLAANFVLNDLGVSDLAIIHDGTTYGQGLAESARDAYAALGGNVTAFEAITPGETDYSAVLTSISANPPGAIFFGGYAPEAAAIVNGLSVAGLGDVKFISDDGTFGSTYIDLAGANAEGTYATSAGVPSGSDAKAAFDARYLETYGTAAGVLSGFTWFGYDASAVLAAAVKEVAIEGADGTLYIPRDALIAAVRGTKDFPGITGTISCSDVGECNATGPAVFEVKDGAFVSYGQ